MAVSPLSRVAPNTVPVMLLPAAGKDLRRRRSRHWPGNAWKLRWMVKLGDDPATGLPATAMW